MQLKMITVVNLVSLYDQFKDQALPIKLNYKVNKLFNAINTESQFYRDELNKLIDQYAERDENNQPVLLNSGMGIKLREGTTDIVQNSLNELWNLDVNLPDIYFTLDELENIQMTVENFNKLLPFIKEAD